MTYHVYYSIKKNYIYTFILKYTKLKAKMYQIHCKLHPLINIISGLWTDFLKVKNL